MALLGKWGWAWHLLDCLGSDGLTPQELEPHSACCAQTTEACLSSRKRQQLRALWLLTCFISEVVSFDLGIMLQTPCNPLGKHGPASVRASPLNPSRIQKRWAKVLRTAEGGCSLWCLGIFAAALPLCSGASVRRGCVHSAGEYPGVVAAVSGKFL